MNNRIIKFRAWWKHPEYNPQGGMFRVGGVMFAKKEEGEPEYDFDNNMPTEIGLADIEGRFVKIGWNDAEQCTLMQFTGLFDKNGTEIYEGDVLLWCGNKSVVEYGGMAFGIKGLEQPDKEYAYDTVTNPAIEKLYDAEVIGNIYENPELLGTK